MATFKRSKSHLLQRGVTLVELMMTIIILVLMAWLATKATTLVNTLYYYQSLIVAQQMADTTATRLMHEIRNAHNIITLEPNKLVFTTFNTEHGYDVNQFDFFAPIAIGTVTYQFETTSKGTQLKRLADFPAAAKRKGINSPFHEESVSCKDILVTPDLTNATTIKDTHLFAPTFGWSTPPFSYAQQDKLNAVHIALRVKLPMKSKLVRVFEQDVVLRTQVK